jgi:hypothetical protein
MIRRRIAGLLLAGALSAAVGLTVAAPASAADPFVIRNTANGFCLQPFAGSVDNGVEIVQQPCDGSQAQQWTRTFNSDGTIGFRNEHSFLCLNARGAAANGTPVVQWVCNFISNQKWSLEGPALPTITRIHSRVSGTNSFCLDPFLQGTPGMGVQIFSCNNNPVQIWSVG